MVSVGSHRRLLVKMEAMFEKRHESTALLWENTPKSGTKGRVNNIDPWSVRL